MSNAKQESKNQSAAPTQGKSTNAQSEIGAQSQTPASERKKDSSQALVKCSTDCGRNADPKCKYQDRMFCRICAHNVTHGWPLPDNGIPCPVFDGNTKELIPYGVYPNIDYT